MSDSPSAGDFPSLGERYVIEAFLGEGAVGTVYRARDCQLRRTVAIKILRSREPDAIARFRREARAQARLDHEHICRVFEIGAFDGRPFIVMQFIEGETLGSLAPTLEIDQKVELIRQVARALQAAHESGVVHCDVKPANVMVERQSDGEPHAHVLDFGIARCCGDRDNDNATATSGTPAFMAPEQVCDGPVGSATDIYGLGATAYGVLAEQTPFHGATRAEVKQMVLLEQPLPLNLVVPGTPEGLETIVSIAMSKEPRRRYPSAKAVADDLARWSKGEPILAREPGVLSWTGAWLWTRRRQAGLMIVLFVSAALAVGTSLWLGRQQDRRTDLVAEYQAEVEQVDRLLRRARMMPLHDTTPAERSTRERLRSVEASLLEHGPLGRGPAYYTLGFGHLLLREFETAERWLRASVDSGFSDPEVESALGVAVAMQLLRDKSDRPMANPVRVKEAVRCLAARGPKTSGRDQFHDALALFVEDEFDAGLALARQSADLTPWLYEARQLEGEILMARSVKKSTNGALEAAIQDLEGAGIAFDRGISVARSDFWLYEGQTKRLVRLVELGRAGDGLDASVLDLMVESALSAATAHPTLAVPLLQECRLVLNQERELDPHRSDLEDLFERLESVQSESHGANSG